ncbi:glycosyltransferase family 4 protein [Salinimicrobium sp. GXAS 041]|uniref:glycosyltransferase family 4 protein n=1 Tax=Salinimicrobium sp. GXAS 041 TaxID=3400806 RepID=UPI003C74E34C
MKKRILYIGNNLTNSTFTATYISFFSEVLKKEGHEVKTASGKDNKLLRLADMLNLIWQNRKSTDVVLIDTYGAQNFYYAYSAAKLCRQLQLPYIPILHGGNLPGRLETSKRKSRDLFGNAKVNIAPSHFLFNIFKAEGFENLKIIPNSINLKTFPFRKREKFEPKLLWVRRFQERYNPMLSLKVFQKLREKYPEAELCMVGPEKDGSLEACREYAEKYDLPVKFTGKLRKKDWATIAADYDFFLNSTNIDNTPISVIEAMALGLPVISTDVDGMPYLIENGKNGVLVPAEDIDAMLKGLTDLLENQDKARQISLAAYEKVKEFDWDKIRHQWNELLSEV